MELNILDNVDLVHGMPVNLQLVGKRLEEEKVLAMTDAVLTAINPPSLAGRLMASIKANI
jgi:amidase